MMLGFGIGEVLSMVLFLEEQREGRQSAQEITKDLKDKRIIDDYVEWLRRKDQKALISAIAKSEDRLLRRLSTLGTAIHGFTDAVQAVVQQSHQDLLLRFKELNSRFIPPVLSPVPLRGRPLADVPLLGREDELAWLRANSKKDVVVFGQPGSGKTYLLYQFVQELLAGYCHRRCGRQDEFDQTSIASA
ncbi:MAG: hypothetical protein HY801_11075 [Candidatus Lindowbacteria bacterium]|nr:hypothetical protein [Candidatus Lindowbacteria bacterium]